MLPSLPGALDFLLYTPIGVSCIVFVLTMFILLIIRPPSVKIVSVEGTKISWFRVIGFSLLAAAAVQIYPLFLMFHSQSQTQARTQTQVETLPGSSPMAMAPPISSGLSGMSGMTGMSGLSESLVEDTIRV